jgi:hypothetical protein
MLQDAIYRKQYQEPIAPDFIGLLVQLRCQLLFRHVRSYNVFDLGEPSHKNNKI